MKGLMALEQRCSQVNGDSHVLLSSEIEDDFDRDVWCVFGLPIDDLSISSAHRLVEQRVRAERKTVLSTVNINWVAMSLSQPEFRAAIIDSDINTIDGMPLLWIARLLGLRAREPVAGSTFASHLLEKQAPNDPISVFFFGGNEGIGERAVAAVNRCGSGLQAVGAHNPGFGGLSADASDESLDRINSASPDILAVALGAFRGQLWIQQHKARLNARIISHLGATIDFLAGSEKRAPQWLQAAGFEWLWRVGQRPSLWRRYAADGLVLLNLLASRLAPLLWTRHNESGADFDPGTLTWVEHDDRIVLRLQGSFTHSNRHYVRERFKQVASRGKEVILDMATVNTVDNSFLGYLLLLMKHQHRAGLRCRLHNSSPRLQRVFKNNLIYLSMDALNDRSEQIG